jgi:hypothetical protein
MRQAQSSGVLALTLNSVLIKRRSTVLAMRFQRISGGTLLVTAT